ncbi:DUF6355 family natural product biosynthesis protein [Spirillospora sp. NPDC029432]|uniref:DUF6355 family natural product biosynthesis protein n=1 Tax=Spirillospora sp. NPDC029432 TaxID=3154599 RepID=UPI0034554EAC
MKTVPFKRVTAVAALATAGLLSAGATAGVAVADEQRAAAQFRCGFHIDSNLNALYGHCDTPPRTDIIINVESGSGDYTMCVPPGVTRLGKWPHISYAAYAGRTCSAR